MENNNYIEQLLEALKQADPLRIILFGSYVNGNQNENSDIDIVVILDNNDVAKTYDERLKKKLYINRLVRNINYKIALDIFVYSKEEYKIIKNNGNYFIDEIENTGKIIYEKASWRWIKFAEKDILTISEIISNPNLTNIVAFHCQQAIEKYFKAFILEKEKPIIKIHNLLTLYGTIKEIMKFDIDEDLLSRINDIYLESRYPGEIGLLDDGSMPTIKQAEQFYTFAKEIKKKIKNKLNCNQK